MISKALIKRDFKITGTLWCVITAVMLLLLFALFYATSGNPAGVMIIQQFYSLFAALLPVFYIGSAAKKLIAEQVDNGSFSYVMSAPIKRRTVTVTQGLYLICSVLMMYLLFCLIGIISFAIWGEFMEVKAFFLLNLGSFLLNLVICGIGFLATCLFNSSAKTTAVATGLPMGFFLLYVVGTFFGSNKLLSYCKYFTIHSLYNAGDILAGSSDIIWQFGVLAALAVVTFVSGGYIFEKKDLPL